jgi:anthranilate synthase component 1
VLVFDNFRHRLQVVVNSRPGSGARPRLRRGEGVIEEMIARLAAPMPNPAPVPHKNGDVRFRSTMGEDAYKKAVVKAKEHIRAGDVVQVVLAHHLEADVPGGAARRLPRSAGAQPVALHVLPPFRRPLGRGILPGDPRPGARGPRHAAPIAGTRPRGASKGEDAALEHELKESEKDRAEHVMLVDLGRNDVGRIAAWGRSGRPSSSRSSATRT